VDRVVPVRWSAPEVISSSLAHGGGAIYKQASDVWAYGVVLYELYSLGRKPHEHLRDNLAVIEFVTVQRGTLGRPDNCPDQDFSLMKRCWSYNYSQRPTMTEIVSYFDFLM